MSMSLATATAYAEKLGESVARLHFGSRPDRAGERSESSASRVSHD